MELSVTYRSGFGIGIVGHTGSNLGTLRHMGCVGGDGQSLATSTLPFALKGGTTHYLQVGSFLGGAGDVYFELKLATP